jgi:hypothetical protein
MPLQTLTVNGNSVVAVPIPDVGAARMLEFGMSDGIALVPGAYTKETQAFVWPGADEWSVKFTLPPIFDSDTRAWTSWMMQLRGMLRATLIGDPTYEGAKGYLVGSVPIVDSVAVAGSNLAGATTLYLRGCAVSTNGVLLPGDRLQLGYRMHQVLDVANTDNTGRTSFEVWPSLREAPADGADVIFNNPKGLFRLSSNTRNYSIDTSRTSSVSFPLVEYRGNGNS